MSPSSPGPLDALRRVVHKAVVGPIKYLSRDGYDARRFWRDRFRRHGASFRGPGDDKLSEEGNRRVYEQAKVVLIDYAERAGADLRSARTLDIGCGPGFFTEALAERGVAPYTGLDITDVLFSDLSSRFPDYRFLRRDITRDRVDGEFDVILMIDVAEHIVSAEALNGALENVRRALAPGGLFLVGPLMERTRRRLFYVRHWAMDEVGDRFHGYTRIPPVPFRNGHLVGVRKPSGA